MRCDVVAHAEKMDPPGQRPRGSLMKLVFELPRLLLAGEPLANDQPGKGHALTVRSSHLPRAGGTLARASGKGRRQHVVSLAQRNLADGADQRHVACQPQLPVQIARRRAGTKSFQVDAVIENECLFASQSLGDVELPRRRGDRQQARVAVEIGDRLPAQGHDVAEVRKARQRQLRGHGAR